MLELKIGAADIQKKNIEGENIYKLHFNFELHVL